MRERLNETEQRKLTEVGFTKADGSPVLTLSDLLEALPDTVEVFRYRPELRWENMSDPIYWEWLEICKDEDVWEASYGKSEFTNPDLRLDYHSKELIEALYNLALAFATAPKEWIDKSDTIYRMFGESEEDYQERLKRLKETEE